ILEEIEHRRHRTLGAAHRGHDVAVTRASLREQPLALPAQTGIGILIELGLPLVEQVAGDALDRVDTLGHDTRTPLARLVRSVQSVVHVLEIAALERDDAAVLIERRSKLLLRRVLSVTGVLDAVHENVALLDADGLERSVIGRGAARRADGEKRDDEDEPESPFACCGHLRSLPGDDTAAGSKQRANRRAFLPPCG